MSDLADSLPVQRAIRLVLRSISYSDALPPWFEPRKVSYSTRETAIRQKVRDYGGNGKPKPAYGIKVPKRTGDNHRVWLIPTTNDQIVIQACVSAVAEAVYAAIDRKQVFSYRYNTDKNQLLLAEHASESWNAFQEESKQRATAGAILQFDLENAFGSIDRRKFIDFVQDRAPKRPEVALLGKVLDSLSNGSPGLPLINDSLFFMGNAYLHVVDEIVSKRCANFIRFVDDYRLFASSRAELEKAFGEITKELSSLGFKANDSKTKLGSEEEYLDAIANAAATASDMAEYTSPILEDVPSATVLKSIVTRAARAPADFLNEGLGRLSLGGVRAMRSTGATGESLKEYRALVSQDQEFIEAVLKLLDTSLKNKEEAWRSIWLIYVLVDVMPIDGALKEKRTTLLNFASTNSGVDDVVRLWARKASAAEGDETKGKDPEMLDELEYRECGERLWKA